VDVSEVRKLVDIVGAKNWAAFDGLLVPNKTVQDTLGAFLGRMNSEQRKLSLELLDEYLIMRDYQFPIKNLLEKIVASTNEKRIFISTVKDFNSKSVKSGGSLSWEFSGYTNLFPDNKFKFFEDPTSEDFINADGYCVLADDFIGSGTQFSTMLSYIRGLNLPVRCDAVAVFVVQEEGRQRIEAEGFSTIFLHNRSKCLQGVAAKNSMPLSEVYRIYDTIEVMTGCAEDFNRGYSASEALVSMKKTPNNTLPIFWHEGRKKWPAPFPRPKN
jgi:hypothetical protein